MIRKVVAPISLILLLAFAALADGGKVETIGPLVDQSAPEALRKALEPKGYRVTLAGGDLVCEVWLRNGIATRAKSEQSGVYYSQLPESTLLGVLSVPKPGADYRGQGLKPGLYTLRYALHPSDGNHLGISPYRDFLLMVPVAVDQNPDALYKFEELVKMSAKASGTNHPSPLSLVPAEGQATYPAVVANEHGHLAFFAKLKTQSGAELPLAFIVKGVAEQ